ncbi:MAG: FkbM family methyltransferase [Armatimonadetes bacterium]|nr:FkbM family methyltransferase [Akkermansiaceae bacterium]
MSALERIAERLMNRLGHFFARRHDRRIDEKLTRYANTRKENVFLVQIGSNDGKTNDPFHDWIVHYDWSGLLVEPVPFVFERLVRNHHGRSKIVPVNAAISDREETKKFFHLRACESSDIPWWYDQIGSFEKSQVLKSQKDIPDLADLLTFTEVKCLSLTTLFETHRIPKINIFHTDLEGYDFEVLKQLDFALWSPDLILFEHKHLDYANRNACAHMLKNQGYKLIEGSADTLAIKNGCSS